MRFEEQIYTSAAELLRGGGHLGVVAQSREFPKHIESELASLRSYSMLPDLPLDGPDKHPPRYVAGARGAAHYSFSRIVFAGADHTGRTTPLVHHLVFGRADLAGDNLAPADIPSVTRQ